jgi:hypothetical protein
MCIHAGCGKRAHWGSCEAPRPRYFPGEPGYGLDDAERAVRIAAGLPMFATDVVDKKPVHKPVHKASVDSPVDTAAVHTSDPAVHNDEDVDTGPNDRRAAYKREWMAKKRATKKDE